MKKGWLFTMLVVLSVVLAACGGEKSAEQTGTSSGTASEATAGSEQASDSVVVKHKLGETTVKKNPEKVIVFDYGVLDTLDQLGIEVAGVPQKSVPSYLAKYQDAKYTNVGGLKEVDFEKVNAMKPDLIIISGRLQDSYEELSKIAPTIYMAVDNADYMNSLSSNVKTLSEIFQKEKEAEDAMTAINASIKELHEKVTKSGKNALIILTNEGKMSAYGAGSRFGLIHDLFGFTPSDANIEASTHGQSITFEYVMKQNPDYLFVVDRGAVLGGKGEAAPAKQFVENDLVKNTTAYKEGHIVYLDPNYWYLSGGGLESIQEMVKEVDASVN